MYWSFILSRQILHPQRRFCHLSDMKIKFWIMHQLISIYISNMHISYDFAMGVWERGLLLCNVSLRCFHSWDIKLYFILRLVFTCIFSSKMCLCTITFNRVKKYLKKILTNSKQFLCKKSWSQRIFTSKITGRFPFRFSWSFPHLNSRFG